MHCFVDIEVWPLTKGQGQNIISYSNSLKVIEHDQKVKKASYGKKSFFILFISEFDLDIDLKMESFFQKVMRKILFVFMQKRKFQNVVSLKTIFKQLALCWKKIKKIFLP